MFIHASDEVVPGGCSNMRPIKWTLVDVIHVSNEVVPGECLYMRPMKWSLVDVHTCVE